MNILSIGNSFSEDATAYLHDMAKSVGKQLTTANLFYPGCTLERHFRNCMANNRDYNLHFNGTMSGFFFSITDALLSRSWDIVTVQQASAYSFKVESYSPYIERLCDEIRRLCPKAKILIHKTWMYEPGSSQLERLTPFDTPDAMYEALSDAYAKAAELVRADGVISSGEVMYRLSKCGVGPVHRDGYHASYGIGRYAIAMTWLRYLTGIEPGEIAFQPSSNPLTDEQIAAVKAIVGEITPLAL